MKLFLLSFLLSCSLVFAQEPSPSGPPPSNCWNGTATNGQGSANEVPCSFDEQSCLTKVESKPGFFNVVRGCLQTQACENQMSNNQPKCYPGRNGIRQCWFCCRGNLCNDLLRRIPDQAEASGEEVA